MKYKYYKSINRNLSVIGFDTSHFSKQNNINFNKDKCVRLLRDAIKKGINYISTSPIYGLGQAEIIVGEAILGVPREDLFISSKLGYVWDETLVVSKNLSKESLYQQIELSLRRLNIEYLDLCVFDLSIGSDDIEEALNSLMSLKADGLIKNIGIAECAIKQLNNFSKEGIIDIFQADFRLCGNECNDNMIYIPHNRESEPLENIYYLVDDPLVGPILTKFYNSFEITSYNNFVERADLLKFYKS